MLPVTPVAAAPDASPPERIGTYRIIDRLGEGGMGTVYRAEQVSPVKRQIALKVLKSAFVSRQAVARFEAERQAMARLSHPNVAQMFEAGTGPDGHPYFAMELVPGVAITEYCDRERLGLPERLALFRAVCSGVQHAHQKGILHRDLKPSNVMVAEVDGQAIPKIIDFGIAKAIDRPLVSETLATGGALIGTLGYLSPEALGSDEGVDTRTDVYALGILLYELLVGVRPFDQDDASLLEVIRRIVEDPAPPPSRAWGRLDAATRQRLAAARRLDAAAAGRRLTGDLAWIIAQAVAKERGERYASVAEFSADIGRHLRDEPVEAGPRGGVYRLRKLVRRNRGFVAAASILFLSLVAGLVFRTVEARRANREAEAARQVTQFLVDTFQVSDPLREAGVDVTARELLARGEARLRRDLPDQPLIRGRLLDTIATVYGNLGLYEESGNLAREALTLRRMHLPAEHPDLITSLETLAAAELRQGHYEQTESLLGEAVALREQANGPADPVLPRSLTLLARALLNRGKLDEAEPHLLRARAIHESTPERDELALAETLNELGRFLEGEGRFDEGEKIVRQALEIRERNVGEDHALIADSLERLGQMLGLAQKFHAAVTELERAVTIREAVFGADHPTIIRPQTLLGQAFAEMGRLDAATVAYERAVTLARAAPDLNPVRLALAMTGLGSVARRQERFAACVDHLRESSALFETVVQAEHSHLGWNQIELGNCRLGLGEIDAAEASFKRAHEIFASFFGANDPTTAVPLHNLASIYLQQGKLAEAEAAYEHNLALWESTFGADHGYVAHACQGLGDVHKAGERWEEAESWYRRALEIREVVLDPGASALRETLSGLAEVLRALGREADALPLEARLDAAANGVGASQAADAEEAEAVGADDA